jgi:hypothetical protein
MACDLIMMLCPQLPDHQFFVARRDSGDKVVTLRSGGPLWDGKKARFVAVAKREIKKLGGLHVGVAFYRLKSGFSQKQRSPAVAVKESTNTLRLEFPKTRTAAPDLALKDPDGRQLTLKD